MVRVEVDSDAIFQQVMQTTKVQAGVRERATRIAGLVRRDLAKAGVEASVNLREHTGPTGRYGMDVVASVAEKDRRRAGRIARRAGRSIRR